jgi:hypothetical protein
MNSAVNSRAEGHTYYSNSYMTAAGVLEWIGTKLTEDGCCDYPNAYGDQFKITVMVEQV